MKLATGRRLALAGLFLLFHCVAAAADPKDVMFATSDGGRVDADLYGQGDKGVVFAHGAIFNKQSWEPLARRIADKGLRALAINFRGYGKSRAGKQGDALDLDVIAAVRWMHKQGVKSVSVVAGSMGGGAAGKAATEMKRGEIDKLILLSPMPISDPGQLKANSILYIASRDEGLAPTVRSQYAQAPQPKQLIMLKGSAHAQNIFDTLQAEHLSDIIVKSLTGTSY